MKINIKNCTFQQRASGAVQMRFKFTVAGKRKSYSFEFSDNEVIHGEEHSPEEAAMFWARKIRKEVDNGKIDLKEFDVGIWLKNHRWENKEETEERDIEQAVKKVSFLQQIDHYLSFSETLAKKGFQQEKEKLSKLKNVLNSDKKRFQWSDMPLPKLKSKHFDDYVNYRLNTDGVTQATIKRELSIVSNIFKLQAMAINGHNPCYPVVCKLKPSKERTRRFNDNFDEKNRLEAAILKHKTRNKANQQDVITIYKLALLTGMRQSEILNIKKSDINFKKSLIHLPETKNGEERYVPLRPSALHLLEGFCIFKCKERFRLAIVAFYKKNKNIPAKVFDAEKKNIWNKIHDDFEEEKLFSYNSSGFKTIWQRIVKRAELDDFRFHDLRHEAISNLFEKTSMRDQEIMAISGHRDHASTKRYLKFRTAHLTDAVAKMDEHDKIEAAAELTRISKLDFEEFEKDPFVLRMVAAELHRFVPMFEKEQPPSKKQIVKDLYDEIVLGIDYYSS